MKKLPGIFFITLCFLFTFSTAFATSWQWVISSDKYGWFFDTDAIHYEMTQGFYPSVDTSRITYWEKQVYTPASANEFAEQTGDWRLRNLAYMLTLKTISLRDKTRTAFVAYYYNGDGDVICSDEYLYIYGSETIVPETFGEEVFFAVRDYARTHHAQLIRNTYNN